MSPLNERSAAPDDHQPDPLAEEAAMPAEAKNAVQVAETPVAPAQVIAADATSIMEVISRAAADPATDVDKLERLFGMYERINAQNAKAAYYGALAEMQPLLPVVGRKGRIVIPGKDGKEAGGSATPYALWEDVNEAIRPHLAAHGFGLSFRVRKENDRVEVTGVLSHRSGHAEETMLSLPMDPSGFKNNVQAIGSSVSYGKRYTAFALLNITSRGEDDDGKAGGAPGTVTEDQADDLRALMDEVKADLNRFLRHFRIEKIADLPAARHEEAVRMLEAKRQAVR